MFSTIYIESDIRDHPRVAEIVARCPDVPVLECERYGEIFNRKGQSFRAQKKAPALILARKHGRCVLPTPAGYGFESGAGFYFSHMLNCLYDCRYCFLQGMYRSAHYVLFVNYEDFGAELLSSIEAQRGKDGTAVYYSGYDCDSLALEPVSLFSEYFLPLFREHPHVMLEIRTKSTQVRRLLEVEAMPNCVIAMSLTSERAGKEWEHKVPALGKRLDALQKLQEAGWPVAIRFEPVVAEPSAESEYEQLFAQVFARLDVGRLHSVSLGEFRMPKGFHKTITRLYPDEALYAREIQVEDGVASLRGSEQIMQAIEASLLSHIAPDTYYRCAQ
jgi:spore photoproduct lyase